MQASSYSQSMQIMNAGAAAPPEAAGLAPKPKRAWVFTVEREIRAATTGACKYMTRDPVSANRQATAAGDARYACSTTAAHVACTRPLKALRIQLTELISSEPDHAGKPGRVAP